jgi:hypothetical protein
LDTACLIDTQWDRSIERSPFGGWLSAATCNLEVMTMPSTRQNPKVRKVMHEYKEGKLKSGSGRKVKSRKQAIAIAMSESGQSKRRKKAS